MPRSTVLALLASFLLASAATAETLTPANRPDYEGNLELLDVVAEDRARGVVPRVNPRRRQPVTLPSHAPWARTPIADCLVALERDYYIDTNPMRRLINGGKVVIELGPGSADAAALYYPASTGRLVLRASELRNGQYPVSDCLKILHELVHALVQFEPSIKLVMDQQVRYEKDLNCTTYNGISAEAAADETAAYWVEEKLAPTLKELKNLSRSASDARARYDQVFAPAGLRVELGQEYVKPAAMRSCKLGVAGRLAIVLGVPKTFSNWTLQPPAIPTGGQRALRMTQAQDQAAAAAVRQVIANDKAKKNPFGDLKADIKSAIVNALAPDTTAAPDGEFARRHELLVGADTAVIIALNRACTELRNERARAAGGGD